MFAKGLHADVSDGILNHVAGIDAYYGDVTPDNGEGEQFFFSMALDVQFYRGTFGTLQFPHHLGVRETHKHGGIGLYNAVACQQAHFLGWSARNE